MATTDEKLQRVYHDLQLLNLAYKADACDLHVSFRVDETRKAGTLLFNVSTSDVPAIRLAIHKIATQFGLSELSIIATAPIQKI